MWNVSPKTAEQREAFQFWENNEDVDFWNPLSPNGKPVRIMIAPRTQESFVSFLESAGIDYELTIPNVETYAFYNYITQLAENVMRNPLIMQNL